MEHGYYSPESASRGSSSTWWYKPNGEAVEVHLVAEPEWAERNFKWKDRIDLGPVAKWAFHNKPKEENMENLNHYGRKTYLEVDLPEGEAILDVRVPLAGDRWLGRYGAVIDTLDHLGGPRTPRIILKPKLSDEEKEYGYQPVVPDGYERIKFDYLNAGDLYIVKNRDASKWVTEYDAGNSTGWGREHKRVIVRKKQTEEEAAYGGTVPPIPEGWEKVGFDYPKKRNYYLDPSYGPTMACFDFTSKKFIILKKKTKRFAVAKVELPEGCETKDKLGYIWIKRNGSQYSEAIETSYQVVEE